MNDVISIVETYAQLRSMVRDMDIIKATPLEDYKVAVEFDNGERGVFDCSRYLNRPYWEPLGDKAFFRQVRVDYGTLVWPDEIDVGQEDVWEFSERIPATSRSII